MSRENDYITEARQFNRLLWAAINGLLALQPEWNALDYGTTLSPGEAQNAGIQPADVGAVVFDTANALKALMQEGHASNVCKLL